MRSKRLRLRIIYVILVVLIGITVGPLWFYGSRMIAMNRDRLETQEGILQTVSSQTMARFISLYMENLNEQLKEFFDTVAPMAARMPAAAFSSSATLRQALEGFVADRPGVLYATVLNDQARGVQAQAHKFNVAGDPFLRKALAAAFTAAQQGQAYRSNPITLPGPEGNGTVMVMGEPLKSNSRFVGMLAAVVTLRPITQELIEANARSGLEAYVVDNGGRLVASFDPDMISGMDMVAIPIVQMFLNWSGRAHGTETSSFPLQKGNSTVMMLGTYSPTNLGWGVIVQRKTSDAYAMVTEMRRQTFQLGLLLVVLSIVIGFVAAKAISSPIDLLTQTARSIARRDYTQRAQIRSRTEIDELAETFNLMADDIQRYITSLKQASEQNRQLFYGSIGMIAQAVDAKHKYTKGHTARVAELSVVLAQELGLTEEEVDQVRISATLHDVGKIGIEDRLLNKPGSLTAEEYARMQQHTVIGYEIVGQVKQLRDMLPGIRSHHEALDGSGYPDALKGDEIPMMARIIAVADAFDAITIEGRSYQEPMQFPEAFNILRRKSGTRYDPAVVNALEAARAKGRLSAPENRSDEDESTPVPDPVSVA